MIFESCEGRVCSESEHRASQWSLNTFYEDYERNKKLNYSAELLSEYQTGVPCDNHDSSSAASAAQVWPSCYCNKARNIKKFIQVGKLAFPEI